MSYASNSYIRFLNDKQKVFYTGKLPEESVSVNIPTENEKENVDGKVISKIFNGYNFYFTLYTDNTLRAFGSNTEAMGATNGSEVILYDFNGNSLATKPKIKDIQCGYNFTCILDEDGYIYTSGNNSYGQLGRGNTVSIGTFRRLTSITDAISISATHGNLFVRRASNNYLYVCGVNSRTYREAGTNSTASSFTSFQPINTTYIANPVKKVVGGTNYNIFLTENGNIYAVGYNYRGRFGIGNNVTSYTYPIKITSYLCDSSGRSLGKSVSSLNIVDIACGATHTMILDSDGYVYVAGYNHYGQLGLNYTYTNLYNSYSFRRANISGISEIYSGVYFSIAKANSTNIYVTGYNHDGQLGLEDNINRISFTKSLYNLSGIDDDGYDKTKTYVDYEQNNNVYVAEGYDSIYIGDIIAFVDKECRLQVYQLSNNSSGRTMKLLTTYYFYTMKIGQHFARNFTNDSSIIYDNNGNRNYEIFEPEICRFIGTNGDKVFLDKSESNYSNSLEFLLLFEGTLYSFTMDYENKVYSNFNLERLDNIPNSNSILNIAYAGLEYNIDNFIEINYSNCYKIIFYSDGIRTVYNNTNISDLIPYYDGIKNINFTRIQKVGSFPIADYNNYIGLNCSGNYSEFTNNYYIFDCYIISDGNLYLCNSHNLLNEKAFIKPVKISSSIIDVENNILDEYITDIISVTTNVNNDRFSYSYQMENNYSLRYQALYISTRSGKIYVVKDLFNQYENINLYGYIIANSNPVFNIRGEIVNLTRVNNHGNLNRYIMITTSDGRISHYPLYNLPRINFDCEDISFVEYTNIYPQQLLYHFKISINERPNTVNVNQLENPFYNSLKMEITMKDIDDNIINSLNNPINLYNFTVNHKNEYICLLSAGCLTKTNNDIITKVELKYNFGTGSYGELSLVVPNIKINTMLYHRDNLILNVSNYSKNTANIKLEYTFKGNSTVYVSDIKEIIGLDSSSNTNNKGCQFLTYNIPNLDKFTIIASQKDKDYSINLIKDYSSESIYAYDDIKRIDTEGRITVNYDHIFNKIYENKSLYDIDFEDIVDMLEYLSHKRYESYDLLDNLEIKNREVNINSLLNSNDSYNPYDPSYSYSIKPNSDIFGNTTPFFQSSGKKYLANNIRMKNPTKSRRYRSNVYINGRKISYREVSDYNNNSEGYFMTYFSNKEIKFNKEQYDYGSPCGGPTPDEENKYYADINVYDESLILSEKELFSFTINERSDIDKLTRDGYVFNIPKTSEYIDTKYISVYLNFRSGMYLNRITLADYELHIIEDTSTYIKFKLILRNEVFCRIGNEVHIMLEDLDKNNSIIFKNTSSNSSKLYSNYYIPLVSLDDNGNAINYYTTSSESVDITVNGYTLIPYLDYKVVNFPLHLQMPSIVLFKRAIQNDLEVEIVVNKYKYIDSITKRNRIEDYHNDSTMVDNNRLENYYENSSNKFIDRYSNFVCFTINTYDKFVDRLKLPNLQENGLSTSNNLYNYFSNIRYSVTNPTIDEYIKFYLEDTKLVRFLISLFNLKIITNGEYLNQCLNITSDVLYDSPAIQKFWNIPVIGNKENIDKDIFEYTKEKRTGGDKITFNNKGLLYLLFEEMDNNLSINNNVVIDCNNSKQLDIDEVIPLDGNNDIKLPYINGDIILDCNYDYNLNNYVNTL